MYDTTEHAVYNFVSHNAMSRNRPSIANVMDELEYQKLLTLISFLAQYLNRLTNVINILNTIGLKKPKNKQTKPLRHHMLN